MRYNTWYLKGCTRAVSAAGCVSDNTYLKGITMHNHTSNSTCFVYLIQSSTAVKVGIANNPQNRLSGLQTSHHEKLTICYTLECPDRQAAQRAEAMIHARYADDRLEGEWFDVDADTIIQDIEWSLHFAEAVSSSTIYRSVETVEYKRIELAPAQPFELPNIFRRAAATFKRTPKKQEFSMRKSQSPKLILAIEWLLENPENMKLSSRKIATLLGISHPWVIEAKRLIDSGEYKDVLSR